MDLVSSTYARSVFLSIPILSLEDTFIYGLKPSKLLSLAFVPWLETNVYKMSSVSDAILLRLDFGS